MIHRNIPVGRIASDWTICSANWIQSEGVCQLDQSINQQDRFSRQLALPTELANLPTGAKPRHTRVSGSWQVGRNSYNYVTEGTDVPSVSRRPLFPRLTDEVNAWDGVCIFGLDLGTQTGWALLNRDGTIISGSESFKPGRFEGGGMRFLRFKRWLTEIKQSADDIDAVYFEEVRRHAGVDAAHAYGGFMAHLTAWCEHHEIPYQGVPVGTIKKHATGKGNAGKSDMISAMVAKGFRPADDNEADALALLHWAIAQEVAA